MGESLEITADTMAFELLKIREKKGRLFLKFLESCQCL